MKRVVVDKGSDILGTTYVICDHPGCSRQFKLTHWDSISAGNEGWFQKKNGEAWCPEHIPEWVSTWRERQAENKARYERMKS